MKKINLNPFLFKIILTTLIISYSIIICFNNNFGWDHDSYAIINGFRELIENNNYIPSRKPGYPVSDLIIGFISYYFGSKVINIFVLISAITASLIFFKTFENNSKEFTLFFILIFSNSTILSNVTIPIDYPITLLFYFLGIFYLKNNKNFFLFCLFFS